MCMAVGISIIIIIIMIHTELCGLTEAIYQLSRSRWNNVGCHQLPGAALAVGYY